MLRPNIQEANYTTTKTVREIAVDADTGDSFDSLWRKVFRRIKWPDDTETLDLQFPHEIEPDHVFLQLGRFGQNDIPIIIIDEYDRIRDNTCRVLMTDFIKSLTRVPNNPTIILVGAVTTMRLNLCTKPALLNGRRALVGRKQIIGTAFHLSYHRIPPMES